MKAIKLKETLKNDFLNFLSMRHPFSIPLEKELPKNGLFWVSSRLPVTACLIAQSLNWTAF
jgi:hypothetical protein